MKIVRSYGYLPDLSDAATAARFPAGTILRLETPIEGGSSEYRSVLDPTAVNDLRWQGAGTLTPVRRGFFDRNQCEPPSIGAAPSRVVTIEKKVGYDAFAVNSGGNTFRFTSNISVTFPDVEGVHYLYVNPLGQFVSTQVFDPRIITEWAFACEVYWDAYNKYAVILAEERHGQTIDGRDHYARHSTVGALLDRLDPLKVCQIYAGTGAPDGGGALNTHAQIAFDHGRIYDEDIWLRSEDTAQILGSHPSQPGAPAFVPAQIPGLYLTGAGIWRKKLADTYPFVQTGAIGPKSDGTTQTIYTGVRPAYNRLNAGVWNLEVLPANNDCVMVHFGFTNDVRHRIQFVLGQNFYATQTLARDALDTELTSIRTILLPTLEWVWLFSMIIRGDSTYANAVDAEIVSTDTGALAFDWRNLRPRLA